MSKRPLQLQASIPWKFCHDPESDLWVAICQPLRITIQAETKDELDDGMLEAIDTMFRDLHKTGDLEKFLSEHGWALATPPASSPEEFSFDLPLNPIEVDARDLAEALC